MNGRYPRKREYLQDSPGSSSSSRNRDFGWNSAGVIERG